MLRWGRRAMKSALAALGYECRRRPIAVAADAPPGLGHEWESEAAAAIAVVRAHTMVPYARLVVLYEQVLHCERVGLPGCLVECGTWKGGASGLMALASLRSGGGRRHLHLFDSFKGIPEPDEAVDGELAVAWARERGAGTRGRLVPIVNAYESVGTLEDNRSLIEGRIGYDPALLHYHEGWFQDTVPRDAGAVGPIAILRLDGDWYSSTRLCLEHLYPGVVDGGFVVVDDYALVAGCRRAVDEYRQRVGSREFLHCLDSEGRFWIKRSRAAGSECPG